METPFCIYGLGVLKTDLSAKESHYIGVFCSFEDKMFVY